MKQNAEKIAEIVTIGIQNMEKREQTETKREAYNYLGKLYALLAKECKKEKPEKTLEFKKKSIENFLSSIGTKKIEINDFCTNEKERNELINKCNDSDLLFSLLCTLCDTCKITENVPENCRNDVLFLLNNRTEKLCKDKSELHKIKQISDKMCDALRTKNKNLPLDEENIIKEIQNYFSNKNGLEGKIIRHRLDVNEKLFDNVLIGRTNFTHCEIKNILVEQ